MRANRLRTFANIYTPLVFRWCRNHGVAAEDADDVIQEVFQAVFQGIDRFKRQTTGQSLRGWLWTITRNKICDHFRRREAQPIAAGGTAPFDPADIPETDTEPAEQVAAELAHRALSVIQTDFEPATWRTFWAMAIDGRSAKEAAAQYGLTEAAAFKAKSRVLNRLRHELDGLLD
jgi:RNA polymerase sigma-70 factor, ECF subfamily